MFIQAKESEEFACRRLFRPIVIWIFGICPVIFFIPRRRRHGKSACRRVQNTDSGRAWVHNGKIIRYVGDVGLGRENVRLDRVTMSVRLRRKARTGIYSDAANGVFGRRRRSCDSRIRNWTVSARKSFTEFWDSAGACKTAKRWA